MNLALRAFMPRKSAPGIFALLRFAPFAFPWCAAVYFSLTPRQSAPGYSTHVLPPLPITTGWSADTTPGANNTLAVKPPAATTPANNRKRIPTPYVTAHAHTEPTEIHIRRRHNLPTHKPRLLSKDLTPGRGCGGAHPWMNPAVGLGTVVPFMGLDRSAIHLPCPLV